MIDEKNLIMDLMSVSICTDTSYGKGMKSTIDVAINIVNRQPKVDDWIPCDERLPEDGKEVLVWYEYFRYGNYNCMYQTFGIGYQFAGYWSGDVRGVKAKCLAWRPLPKPYIPTED